MLMLDLSGSVEYNLVMDFARALTLALNIDNDAVRVGVVAFSDDVVRVYQLDQFVGEQRSVFEALTFRHYRGATNIQVTGDNSPVAMAAPGFLPPGAKVRGAAPPTGNTHPQCTE